MLCVYGSTEAIWEGSLLRYRVHVTICPCACCMSTTWERCTPLSSLQLQRSNRNVLRNRYYHHCSTVRCVMCCVLVKISSLRTKIRSAQSGSLPCVSKKSLSWYAYSIPCGVSGSWGVSHPML